MFSMPDEKYIDDLKNSDMYKSALECFKNGNSKKGHELLSQLSKSTEFEPIKKFYNDNDDKITRGLRDLGIINLGKNDVIPAGYCRNSFTDKTCITTQQKDLPEWKNIIAEVIHNNKSVYEDHYLLKMTTISCLMQIKRENPGEFIGKMVVSNENIDNVISKFSKNSLSLIIDRLEITILDNFDVPILLSRFADLEYLQIVVLNYQNLECNDEMIRKIKLLFIKSNWSDVEIAHKCGIRKFTK
jgi:hypothetical protein